MTDKITRTVIPAAPGWFVAIVLTGQPTEFSHEPIVAWSVEEYSEDDPDNGYVQYATIPITIDPNANDYCRRNHSCVKWMLRDPAGIYRDEGSEWATADAALKYIEVLRQAKAAELKVATS